MRIRHIKDSETNIKKSNFYLNHLLYNKKNSISSHNVFDNDNPIYLELGMGKGKFLIESAIKNPNINYIGIEKNATIIMHAYNTINKYSKDINNIKIMCIDIINLLEYFDKQSIDKIYLNFSDPWPKKRHENRRLTSKTYINIYKNMLKSSANIELKTDSLSLFDYSLESFKNNNFNILYYTYDLHNDIEAMKNNIFTEYEIKSSNNGNKINKLITST